MLVDERADRVEPVRSGVVDPAVPVEEEPVMYDARAGSRDDLLAVAVQDGAATGSRRPSPPRVVGNHSAERISRVGGSRSRPFPCPVCGGRALWRRRSWRSGWVCARCGPPRHLYDDIENYEENR